MKTKRRVSPKPKLRKRAVTPTATLKCRKCGDEAVSYFRHALWFYSDDFEGKQEIWGYCAKHASAVLDTCPTDIKMVFEKHHYVYPDVRNEIILHRNKDITIGNLASKLKANKKFPSDDRIIDLIEKWKKTGKTEYLVYNDKGMFKMKFNKYSDACDYYTPKDEVLMYVGTNNFYVKGASNDQ